MSLNLTKPFFALAPMEDVTDTVFRQVISSCAPPDICFSEFVNVDGLMSKGRPRLLKMLDRAPAEPPLIAHIWGLNPANFYAVADQLASGELAAELGLSNNFGGIDLNMGCPVRAVIKTGACSALINNQPLAKQIIDATKKGIAGRLPVSVKTRLGFSKIEPEWTKFLLSQDLAMLSVHLRTSKEMSAVPAHFTELKRLNSERLDISPQTLLIANGDILSRAQGEDLVKNYQVDGVMIGRGVFSDPFVFSPNSPWSTMPKAQRIELLIKHLNLFDAWADNPNKQVKRLNKYAKIYLSGFDGAKDMREQLAKTNTVQQMKDLALSYL